MARAKGREVVAAKAGKEPVPLHPALTGGGTLTIGNIKLRVTRQVTLPHLKHEEGQIVAFKILCPIYVGENLIETDKGELAPKDAKPKAAPMAPPHLVRCTNLEDHNDYTYIIGAVVQSNLERTYPDETYVGKCFAIIKGPKQPGKRYHQYAVHEVAE